MDPFTLIVGKTSVEVKNHWIARWAFINDLYNDLGTKEVEWTYTPLKELRMWIQLNESMDDRGEVMPLSSIWKTVQFMNPTDASYLEYVDIDSLMPSETRKELLRELGQFIRMRGVMPDYLLVDDGEGKVGIYFHFNLYDDPIYGVRYRDELMINLDQMKDDTRQLVIDLPLVTITGIMQQAWLASFGKKRTKEDNWMNEIPWYYVKWEDVALFAPDDYSSTINALYHLIHLDYKYRDNPGAEVYLISRHGLTGRLDSRYRTIYELPFLLTSIQRPSSESSDRSKIRFYVGQNEKVVPRIPRFDLFWSRIIERMKNKEEVSEFIGDYADPYDMGLYRLISSTQMINPIRAKRDKVQDLSMTLLHYNSCLLTNHREQRQVDSLEYPAICQRIAETVGSKTLEAYSNYFLLLIENNKIEGIELSRALSFVQACSATLDEYELSDFIKPPTVVSSKEKEEG